MASSFAKGTVYRRLFKEVPGKMLTTASLPAKWPAQAFLITVVRIILFFVLGLLQNPLHPPRHPSNTKIMIAGRDSTPPTMLLALSHSIGALKSAVLMDVDRSPEDHQFFNNECAILETHFNALFTLQSNIHNYELLNIEQAQSAIDIGDAILDRGVRRAKKRTALELANIDASAVDQAFPSDIEEIVDAERKVEPKLVLDVVNKFKFIPAFNGKAEVEADLSSRATKQKDNFLAREAAETHADGLDNEAAALVIAAADALYTLEKRLLERFPREKAYVRAFFLDVRRKRKSRKQEPNTP